MRITNKIMQNNSLYNINNNKVIEDQLNTMMSTGKKITRPSDDPVIAIRALRLRSNVTQLSQYYEKNAKDAESWLQVTADALSTVTAVLTDGVKQATKGSNKDLTLDDLETIVTQMDALSKEYYATGNVDFAGRYVFTGYRTNDPLAFDKTTTAEYKNINDEFNAADVDDSDRITGKWKLDSSNVLDPTFSPTYEHDIVENTVGRLRLSYDNLDYHEDDVYNETTGKSLPVLKYREDMTQPATSTLSHTEPQPTIDLTFKNTKGKTFYAALPLSETGDTKTITSEGVTYTATKNADGSYYVEGVDSNSGETYQINITAEGIYDPTGSTVDSAIANIQERSISTITYTSGTTVKTVDVPLLPAIDQTYTINLEDQGYQVTVNSDGTYTLTDTATSDVHEVVQITGNGSVYSSYMETSVTIDQDHIIYQTTSEEDIDKAYEDLIDNPDAPLAYLNAATGEVLLNKYLRDKLSSLPDIINANTVDMVYDKKEWENGDIKPEHLFSCEYTNESKKKILYNQGSAAHDIAYDVGFAQSVVVNTTADDVFTTDVKRDVDDLTNILQELKQMDSTLKNLKGKLDSTTDEAQKAKIQSQIDATTKAYDYLRENIQKEFEHKITSMQKALDVANIAVTDNGTRAKRLDLISDRLMNQSTTFQTLKSENEDIDLAEAATKLTTAQVTYEASLIATGKISQTSLLNYL